MTVVEKNVPAKLVMIVAGSFAVRGKNGVAAFFRVRVDLRIGHQGRQRAAGNLAHVIGVADFVRPQRLARWQRRSLAAGADENFPVRRIARHEQVQRHLGGGRPGNDGKLSRVVMGVDFLREKKFAKIHLAVLFGRALSLRRTESEIERRDHN